VGGPAMDAFLQHVLTYTTALPTTGSRHRYRVLGNPGSGSGLYTCNIPV
jgi:hypothetical protein